MNTIQIIKDPEVPKEKAIAAVGSKAKLARLLGIARSSVTAWGEYVPPYQAYRLLQIYPDLDK
ncbi:MAG: hypothetical protein KGZ88_11970 [Methylomicrobium sp.]|nr:hypothetical protein [Methylomicrobium sp.]